MGKQAEIQHIGIIMDGNRRWAKGHDLPTFDGHFQGYKALIDIVGHCKKRGIKILTVFAFSTENWKRTKDEVNYLLHLFSQIFDEQIQHCIDENIRLRCIGDISAFPAKLHKEMLTAMEKTKHCSALTFNIAVNYGGRAEILHAIRKLTSNGVDVGTLTEEQFSSYLYTADLPDPDLIIRTSGEQRLSNFLTWQNVYSELYFADVHWPDFTPAELDKAIDEFSRRQRRFGQ